MLYRSKLLHLLGSLSYRFLFNKPTNLCTINNMFSTHSGNMFTFPKFNPPGSRFKSGLAFKQYDVLRLRCRDCYFKKIDDLMYVFCRTHPRHKQKQRVIDIRSKWIVTHVTYGRKKF